MIDLHKLLAEMVISGLPGYKLCKIECNAGHLVGYAKVPIDAEPQMVAVQCHECSEIASIGSLLVEEKRSKQAVKEEPKEKPPRKEEAKKEGPPKEEDLNNLSDEELAYRLRNAPKKSALAKSLYAIRNARSLAKARQIREDQLLEEMGKMSANIDALWSHFKPVNCQEQLDHLIKAHPYSHGGDIPPEILFTAFWLAHELWQDKFVDQLLNAWKFPSIGALRQRIGKLWDWLDNSVKLKMPFLAKAHIAPRVAMEALQKIAEKASHENAHEKTPSHDDEKPTFTVIHGEEPLRKTG